MSERTITLHSFASVKGGVGKSTLAIVTAKLLARAGRVPAVVDCDLTGTSIADGLHLCAPDAVLCEDGSVDMDASSTGRWLSFEETMRQRTMRRDAGWEGRVHPPPYFNDVLNTLDARWSEGRSEPVRVDAVVWHHQRDDRVLYLPSSALQQDIARSLEWYNDRDAFDWAECLMWALDDFAGQVPALTDVVLDLPPGTWGFSHETMLIAAMLHRGKPLPEGLPRWTDGPIRWRANPFLVTSGDSNDLVPALEYLGKNHLENLRFLKLLANRADEGIEIVRERGRRRLGSTLEATGLDLLVERVGYMSTLAQIFKGGDVNVADFDQEDVRALRGALRLEEEA